MCRHCRHYDTVDVYMSCSTSTETSTIIDYSGTPLQPITIKYPYWFYTWNYVPGMLLLLLLLLLSLLLQLQLLLLD